MFQMKIIVSKIPEEGIEIHSSENAKSLNINPSDLILEDDVHIDATIRREDKIFFVDGTIKTVLCLTCSRCAREFPYTVDTFFHCHEESVSDTDIEIELALQEGDMDIDRYVGDEVDINSLFREQVILAVPMHPLCKQDCLGLCARCGQDLNTKKCNCQQEEAENPFVALKRLFEREQKSKCKNQNAK